jgi:MFS family permease
MLAIQKRLTNTFYAMLSLPATAMGFALAVQISALSWLLGTKYGLEIEEVGLVWAAGPISGILGQVIIGIISDQVWFWGGRRRPFILIGGVIAALMLLALPNIDIISGALGLDGIIGVAILVALTLDLAINVSFNPTRSIIADVTPEGQERTKGYTWMQTISGTFGVLAYFIGAMIGNYVLIYIGAGLVLLFSILPTLFIEEPRVLGQDDSQPGDMGPTARPHPEDMQDKLEVALKPPAVSLREIMMTIQPLWGFLLYAVYGLTVRLADIHPGHYYVELFCLLVTAVLIVQALLRKETGKSKAEAGLIGFQKVLAAHSFTWIGVQAMFIYMYAYLQYRMPGVEDNKLGSMVAWSFFWLNLVGAILPVTVLEPITRRIGRVWTHAGCIGIMALGYFGMALAGNTEAVIYGLMIVLGIGWGAVVSLPFAIMSQKVNQAKMGLYMGLFNLSVVLPQLVASLGVGQILGQAQDKSIVFLICAGTLAVSAVAWMLVREE